jgi:hypothetical protein
LVEQHQGIVIFTPPVAGTYYVYWLPYTQSGIGHITFAWDTPQAENDTWTSVGSWTGASILTLLC